MMYMIARRANLVSMIVVLLGSVAVRGQTTAPPTTPGVDPKLDAILTRLEDRDVNTLHARVTWQQRYITDEESDATSKFGEIWFKRGKPVAQFLIRFDSKISGARKDKLDEKYLFDGVWYVELQSRTRTVTRRQVRKPDDPADPYTIGEGVFPLPFGQKKADILKEFRVELMEPDQKDPPNTDHIRLTPRETAQTGKRYKRLDFWVARAGPTAGLPVRVRVAKLAGTGKVNSYITVTFRDVQLDGELSAGLFTLETPAGYEEIVEPLEEAAAPQP